MRRSALLRAAAAAVAMLSTLPLLHPLFAQPAWVLYPAAAVLVVALLRASAAGLGLAQWPVPALQAAALTLLLTALFAPAGAVAGVLPTPAAVGELSALARAGAEEIGANPSPVQFSPGIGLIVVGALGLLALYVDFAAAAGRPAAAGLAPVALMVVPLTVHHTGVGWAPFLLAAAGFLVLLSVDTWDRSRRWSQESGTAGRGEPVRTAPPVSGHARTGVQVGAVAVAAALLLPAAVPGLTKDALYTMTSGHRAEGGTVTTTHPMVSLRRDLLSPSDATILEYRTDKPRPEYLRTHVLDVFDGTDWTMSSLTAARQHRIEDDELPPPPGTYDTDELYETTVRVESEIGPMDFLALPYPAHEVEVEGTWYADPATLMVFSVEDHVSDGEYTVRSAQSESTPEGLAEAPSSYDAVPPRYTEVPEGLNEEVHSLTERIVADAETPHEQALALQEWFTGGSFTYSLDPPAVLSSSDPLSDFLLETRTGYCEQFAGAMAIMARIAGIPARVAVGYTPGDYEGEDRWAVTGENAHAWPEVYFEGHGWMRFEPTPSAPGEQSSATVPEHARAGEQEDDAEADQEGGSADADAQGGGNAQDPGADPDELLAGPYLNEGGGAAVADEQRWGWPLVAAGALAALLTVPAALRILVGRLRFARARDDSALARASWLELRDHCRDLGLPWNPAHSPRAAVRELAQALEPTRPAREAMNRIALAEERARYAPSAESPPGLRQDATRVRRALAAACRRGTRLRARLLPRSLWPAKQA